jgi:hypothetical protein
VESLYQGILENAQKDPETRKKEENLKKEEEEIGFVTTSNIPLED